MDTDTKTTGRESDKFMLRFPDGMRDRIAEVAKSNGRSMNAEIVARLQQSFEAPGNKDAQDKLLVAGFVLRTVQNAVTDAELKEDIGVMAKYISGEGGEDRAVAALAKIDAARKLARQTMAKHGKEEVCDPPMGIDTPQRPALPAWQDVLGAAEQLVRQKPAFPKYIKGTVLENDVPVWIATFTQQMLVRELSRIFCGDG